MSPWLNGRDAPKEEKMSSAKEAVVIVDKKDLEKLGAKIGKLGEQLGELTEAFALIAGTQKPVKKTRAPKAAQQEAAQTEAPAEEPAQQVQAPLVAEVKAPKVAAPKAAPATPAAPAKTVVAKAPVPSKANGATKVAAPRMPGAH